MDLGQLYRRASPIWLEALFLSIAAALLSWQLLLPGFIGLANNGDFPKVAGPLCLEGVDHETDKFAYFQPDYVRAPASCYNPRIPSSEILPAWIASSVERIFGDKTRFDIRWLGALHAIVFIAIVYLVLLVLRPVRLSMRIVLALAALWIFADVGFVAYLNTFYSDVPAMLGGLAAIFLAVRLARSETINPFMLGLFGLAALFFITSKAQHGVMGFIPLAAAIWFVWRARTPRGRLAGGLVAFALIAGMGWVIDRTPGWYTAQSRFNLIFAKIARNSKTPALDLRELGLDHSDARYVGMHAFMPGNPLDNAAFRERFYARTSYWNVAEFYVRHPGRAIAILESDLRSEAPLRRVYSNFPRNYGRPPGAKANGSAHGARCVPLYSCYGLSISWSGTWW